jgi:hypothetical protein
MVVGRATPLALRSFPSGLSASALIGEVGMDETKLEKLARVSGKATAKGLDALARHGFDLRAKLSAPISRVPRRAPPSEKPKSDE